MPSENLLVREVSIACLWKKELCAEIVQHIKWVEITNQIYTVVVLLWMTYSTHHTGGFVSFSQKFELLSTNGETKTTKTVKLRDSSALNEK